MKLKVNCRPRTFLTICDIGLVRTVVSISHCGCDDPGSIPGLDKLIYSFAPPPPQDHTCQYFCCSASTQQGNCMRIFRDDIFTLLLSFTNITEVTVSMV